MDWYYAKHGKQEGPVTLEELRAKFQSGELSATDLIWQNGMSEWSPAGSVPAVSAADETQAESAPASQGGLPVVGGASSSQPAPQQTPVSGGQALAQPVAGLAQGAIPPTPGLAIASLVCGIVGLMLACCYGAGSLVGIAAVICGHIQMGKYKETPNVQTGKGLVIAGLITGYLSILAGVAMVVLIVIGVMADMGNL